MILYSSGTTGLPKPIIHAGGPLLIQLKKEHVLHGDFTHNDVFFQFTTCAWMMWPWLVGGLSAGATILVFDGSPFKPTPISLWELCEQEGVTAFGTSAKYIASLEQANIMPSNPLTSTNLESQLKLSKLRLIMSTGSVLPPSSFEYVYNAFPSTVQLASITGGTDICSLFGAPCPTLPVYTGEIQCRALGMAVAAFDDTATEVPPNHPGELVCTRVFPIMPVGFWGPDGDVKYRTSYFARFPGIWHHGDYVVITKHGGMLMLGRSDSILNPAGVRFGSAEVYNVLLAKFPEISDSVCVGQQKEGEADERVLLFVKMEEGKKFTPEVVGRIKKSIREDLSARHVPALISECPDIPVSPTTGFADGSTLSIEKRLRLQLRVLSVAELLW
jgi:acetoacetyl-CoA synthetase